MPANKTKAHTKYFDANGNLVVGTTTVINVLDKPALVAWSNRLGLQGIDSTRYKDKLADVGTVTHLRILHYLKKTEPDLSEYSPATIKLSINLWLILPSSVANFLHHIKPVGSSCPWRVILLIYGKG